MAPAASTGAGRRSYGRRFVGAAALAASCVLGVRSCFVALGRVSGRRLPTLTAEPAAASQEMPWAVEAPSGSLAGAVIASLTLAGVVAAAAAGQRSRSCRQAGGNADCAADEVREAASDVLGRKAQCEHPDRPPHMLCGDCPRNGFRCTKGVKASCVAAAMISSRKAVCEHPERQGAMICGDCPRNGRLCAPEIDEP
eukprot:TRINITY_DN4005_c0_g1_i2.p2 TRINITY_DN4005_c0_g1~~TRINITY_DN4005_c0_g1_i2.p2  ORF type:complete len:197 (-),score=35.92 TRINITY_DN4005_c0_g1_i2:332-922(-)